MPRQSRHLLWVGLQLLFVATSISAVSAQESAMGISLGAKSVSLFGWGHDGSSDYLATLSFSQQTPWASGDDRFVDVSVLWGKRLSHWSGGWLRVAVGPAWVTHSSDPAIEGKSTLGLSVLADTATDVLPFSATRGIGIGLVGRTNLNPRAAFFSVGLSVYLAAR